MAQYGWDYDRLGRDSRGYRGGGFAGGYGYGPPDDHYRAGAYRYGADYGSPYDRDYKSRAQTNYGDPFGDRGRGVPFRVMQGEFNARDRGGAGMRGYDGGFRGYDNGFRGRPRNRYDRGGW